MISVHFFLFFPVKVLLIVVLGIEPSPRQASLYGIKLSPLKLYLYL